MVKKRTWSVGLLQTAVANSRSIRQVLFSLGLRESGGNYAQAKKYILEHNLDDSHFTGSTWNKGLHGIGKPRKPLDEILVSPSTFQSYKLKNRLYKAGLKKPACEECGWKKQSEDGRLPLELDHVNGIGTDNRLENLRILCPNCHSLKPTHRGRNRNSIARARVEKLVNSRNLKFRAERLAGSSPAPGI